jgi:hypothetical protein
VVNSGERNGYIFNFQIAKIKELRKPLIEHLERELLLNQFIVCYCEQVIAEIVSIFVKFEYFIAHVGDVLNN